MIQEVRKEDYAVLFAFTRLEWRLTNWGFACVELGENSGAWSFPMVMRVGTLKGIFYTSLCLFCLGGNTKARCWLVHKCQVLHKALHSDYCRCKRQTGGEEQASLPKRYASAMASALNNLNEQTLPICPSFRPSWVRKGFKKRHQTLGRYSTQQ